MKKLCFLLLVLFIITGCENQNEKETAKYFSECKNLVCENIDFSLKKGCCRETEPEIIELMYDGDGLGEMVSFCSKSSGICFN